MADDPAAADSLFCPACDYDLRGLGSGSCPECGAAFDLDELRRPQTPWSHRRRLGRFRAYWRTVWLVVFRNQRFCREVCRPVSWSDAQRFRWVTVLHVYVGLAIVTWAVGTAREFKWFDDRDLNDWLGPVWPVVIGHVLFLLWLAAVTGVQSDWFQPRRLDAHRQSRAVALSHYTCAPLALAPVAAALFGFAFARYVGRIEWWSLDELRITSWGLRYAPLPLKLGSALAAIELLIWWLLQIQVARRTAERRDLELLIFAATLPVCWLLLAALIFVGIPLVVGYVVIVITSLA